MIFLVSDKCRNTLIRTCIQYSVQLFGDKLVSYTSSIKVGAMTVALMFHVPCSIIKRGIKTQQELCIVKHREEILTSIHAVFRQDPLNHIK